jgi:hypothetical protein
LLKSLPSLSMTFVPHPSDFWRTRISLPIPQYSKVNSRLTKRAPALARIEFAPLVPGETPHSGPVNLV